VLSVGTKIIDLGWPWTAKKKRCVFWSPLHKFEWR